MAYFSLNEILSIIGNEPALSGPPTGIIDIEIERVLRERDKEGLVRLLRYTVIATKEALAKKFKEEDHVR